MTNPINLNGNGRSGITLQWLLAMACAGIVSYFTSQGLTNSRLAVLETQSAERWAYVTDALSRIEARQTAQDAEFRRVMREWAAGFDRRTGEPLPLQRRFEP